MPKQLLFVKAKSRLGLINPPHNESNPNIGVEQGPDYVLSNEFSNQFPVHDELIYEFSTPEKVSLAEYYNVLAREYEKVINLISTKLNPSKILVTVGGDHSIALGSLGAVLKAFNPIKTGVIMIDSHGDIHQPSSSPSGNFHGMWLRPVLEKFEVDCIDKLVPKKIPNENLFYIGNLDIEIEEREYMESHGIEEFLDKNLESPRLLRKLNEFINSMDHIHLSIDIDAFTHTFAPATGMMIENGLDPKDIFPILEKLKSAKSLSVDLVEVNPIMEGHEKTIKLAQELLKTLLL
jgi:arginase